MAPNFPEVNRIELIASPLELVICQLRFPLVLGLSTGAPPEAFHKRIADKYPIVTRRQITSVEIGEAGVKGMASFLWAFEDKNGNWTVSLAPNFLSIETKKYTRFEEFVARFLEVMGIVREMYDVKLQERLGLRYVDHFSKAIQPNLPDHWITLIRPELIPMRSLKAAEEKQHASFESRFSRRDFILAIRGVYLEKGFPGVTTDELVLDFDCYTEARADFDGVEKALLEYRSHSYLAFRWAIGDLIQHFQPTVRGAS